MLLVEARLLTIVRKTSTGLPCVINTPPKQDGQKLYSLMCIHTNFSSNYVGSILARWVYRISGYFHVIKGSREKISRSKTFALWAFYENLTWRKRGGVWKGLVHSWLPRLPWNLGGSYWSSYTMMAGVLANFGLKSQTILPIWPTFPTRCGTDGFSHFSICCSNCLGWYWGRPWTWTNLLDLGSGRPLRYFVVEKIPCV